MVAGARLAGVRTKRWARRLAAVDAVLLLTSYLPGVFRRGPVTTVQGVYFAAALLLVICAGVLYAFGRSVSSRPLLAGIFRLVFVTPGWARWVGIAAIAGAIAYAIGGAILATSASDVSDNHECVAQPRSSVCVRNADHAGDWLRSDTRVVALGALGFLVALGTGDLRRGGGT
jgi:hypothetical protein